jgi:TolA-binding protein
MSLLAAVGAAAIAAIAGCGGGSDELSAEQFQRDANKVCRDVEDQLDRVQGTIPTSADQAEKQAQAIVDLSEQALDNLRRIDPPEELKPTYDRYLDARERATGFVEDARDAAADKDNDGYARAKRRLAAGQPDRRALALRLNLNACSRVSVPDSLKRPNGG